MEISMELRRLCAEHQQLRQYSDDLMAIMASADTSLPADLLPLWQEYRILLVRHLKCEDWILYPSLRSGEDQAVAALADAIFREVGGLHDALEAFDAAWDDPARLADPSGYIQAMRSVLQRVSERTQQEEERLFPAAAAMQIVAPRLNEAVHGVDLIPSLA